ncbi:MAG TPA: ABC transporter permease [Streptosporangiaceae bacterium]|jgi:lipooligosaccharide transport system permease protein
MTAPALRALPLRVLPAPLLAAARGLGGRRSGHLIERHARAYQHAWLQLVSGVFEPLFYLLAIGVGIGKLVGGVSGPGGAPVSYASFVAPALLATAAANGAVFDSTFNVFFRLKYAKLYDATLATPMGAGDVALGEIGWALLRGGLYAIAFTMVMLAMGLVHSVWAVAALPVALLIGFGFAATGMAATTFMKSWQHFEFVTVALLPMFLFSATFYPLSVYPGPVRVIVEWSPLYQGVVLMRGLTLGVVGPGLLWHVAYLALLGLAGLAVAGRRITRLLLR